MKKTKEAGAEETNAERGGMGEGTKRRERERESERFDDEGTVGEKGRVRGRAQPEERKYM